MPPPLPWPVVIQHARCLRHIPTTPPAVSTRRRFETAPPSPVAPRVGDPAPETTTRLRLLPRVLQADMLKSYFSPFLRRSRRAPPPGLQLQKQKVKKEEWNPYTFFIAAFLVIGSQAINLIALKHEHKDFIRRTGNRIDLLREVIEGIEKGQDVQVEKLLGTGVESEEKAWEELLKEIEQEDIMWQERRASSKKDAKKVPNGGAAQREQERKPKGMHENFVSTGLMSIRLAEFKSTMYKQQVSIDNL